MCVPPGGPSPDPRPSHPLAVPLKYLGRKRGWYALNPKVLRWVAIVALAAMLITTILATLGTAVQW